MALDCLLIGHYDEDFGDQVDRAHRMGTAGSYSDMRLAFISEGSRRFRLLDAINEFAPAGSLTSEYTLDNFDFLSPAVHQIGSYIARRGYEFDFVNLPHRDVESLASKIAENSPRCIAITTTFHVSPEPIIALISRLRGLSVTCPIVVGGPFVVERSRVFDDSDLAGLMRIIDADIAVLSRDGEVAFAELLGALRKGGDLSQVPDIAWFDASGMFRRNTPRPTQIDLVADRPGFDAFAPGIATPFLSLLTARSCPFNCAFCGFPGRAGQYRTLTPDVVIEAFDEAAEQGVKRLTILDDTFNVPVKRFRDILERMIERRYPFRWNSFFRSDFGDDEIVDMMAAAGCEGVFLGIESASDIVLSAMRKSARKKDYSWAIPAFRSVDITTYTSFIVGFPGETMETVRETSDFIESVAPDYYRAQLFYLDESAPIWTHRDEFELKGGGFNWSHRTMDSEIASAHVEGMFLRLGGARWMPQNGFEIWSIYYLRQLGASDTAINRLLDSFNATVADEIISEDCSQPTDIGLRAEFVDACRLDQKDVGASPPQPRFAGALNHWDAIFARVPLTRSTTDRPYRSVIDLSNMPPVERAAFAIGRIGVAVQAELGCDGLIAVTGPNGTTDFTQDAHQANGLATAPLGEDKVRCLPYAFQTHAARRGKPSRRPTVAVEVACGYEGAPDYGAPVRVSIPTDGNGLVIEAAGRQFLHSVTAAIARRENEVVDPIPPEERFSFEI